jgi:hypothetical protein
MAECAGIGGRAMYLADIAGVVIAIPRNTPGGEADVESGE